MRPCQLARVPIPPVTAAGRLGRLSPPNPASPGGQGSLSQDFPAAPACSAPPSWALEAPPTAVVGAGHRHQHGSPGWQRHDRHEALTHALTRTRTITHAEVLRVFSHRGTASCRGGRPFFVVSVATAFSGFRRAQLGWAARPCPCRRDIPRLFQGRPLSVDI